MVFCENSDGKMFVGRAVSGRLTVPDGSLQYEALNVSLRRSGYSSYASLGSLKHTRYLAYDEGACI